MTAAASEAQGHRRSAWTLFLVVVVAWTSAACAVRSFQPSIETRARAAATSTYRGELRVAVDGPSLRGHARALVAFRRPDALRLEVPGPAGARMIAVASGPSLIAVFPAERAYYEGAPDADTMESLVGVALAPHELMDMLVGTSAERVRSYQAAWRAELPLPQRFRAELADGTTLDVRARSAERDCLLSDRAFAIPSVAGMRALSLAEARSVWAR